MSAIGVAISLCGCESRPSGEECEALLDHYVILLLREEQPEAAPAQIAKHQREARARAANDEHFEFGACAQKVSRRQVRCALAAVSVNQVEQCLL
jgi:hypothetical protein